MGRKRRCDKGKPCAGACVNRDKVCRIELPSAGKGLDKVQTVLKEPPKRPTNAGKLQGSLKEPPKRPAGITIGDDSRKAAKEILAKYAKSEPKATALLSDLANKHGMELVGLKHRLKSEDSLARKIESEKDAFGGSARKTAQSMSDINRYTMQVPPGNYGQSVKDVLAKLQAEGYNIRIKNYWSPDAGPYRGLNVALTAPDGRKIELQFHTEDSLRIKSKTHKDYEEYRVSKDNERRKVLWDRMVKVTMTIPMPNEALTIGKPEDLKKLKFELLQ